VRSSASRVSRRAGSVARGGKEGAWRWFGALWAHASHEVRSPCGSRLTLRLLHLSEPRLEGARTGATRGVLSGKPRWRHIVPIFLVEHLQVAYVLNAPHP